MPRNEDKDFCKRGHPFSPENTLNASPPNRAYRRCRACNRAISHVSNWLKRYGIEMDVDQVADEKYDEIKTALK